MAKTKMQLTPATKHARCREILGLLDANIHEVLRLAALVNRLKDHEDVRTAFEQTYEANGLKVVFEALRRQVVMVLARMYDPYDPTNDKGGDRASLKHLMDLLADKAVIRIFLDDARKWLPDMNRQERDALIALKAIQRARVRYRRLTNSEAAKWLVAIKDFRNIHLAHSLFGKTTNEPMCDRAISDVLRGTKELIPFLRLGLDGQEWNWEDRDKINAKMADAFWEVVLLGMVAKKRATKGEELTELLTAG